MTFVLMFPTTGWMMTKSNIFLNSQNLKNLFYKAIL